MRYDYFGVSQRVSKLYGKFLEPVCQRHGLTKNELDVLLFLYNNPEYDRARDVVVHRGLVKSHVSLSVTNLQARGLLSGETDSTDRRIVRLRLTDEGRSVAGEGRSVQEAFFSRLFAGIDREEMEISLKIKQIVSANAAQMSEE